MAPAASHPLSTFSSFDLRTGCLFDGRDGEFPTLLYAWTDDETLPLANPTADALFGYVYQGPTRLDAEHNSYRLITGQYFCISEGLELSGGAGILVRRVGFCGQNLLGGPVEAVGRLRYINGCTDSLLIPPVKFGSPCLNALYFPRAIDQTPHTHPSIRVGITASGRGHCISPQRTEALLPGKAFVIHAGGVHSFRTDRESGMVVIAYHPDSDFGPQDEDHPMINRTIVDGVSASRLQALQTR